MFHIFIQNIVFSFCSCLCAAIRVQPGRSSSNNWWTIATRAVCRTTSFCSICARWSSKRDSRAWSSRTARRNLRGVHYNTQTYTRRAGRLTLKLYIYILFIKRESTAPAARRQAPSHIVIRADVCTIHQWVGFLVLAAVAVVLFNGRRGRV